LQCYNHTPSDLEGLYRGIEIQKGFELGEVDFKFSGMKDLEIKDQKGVITHGTVSTHSGSMWIAMADGSNAGKTIKILQSDMNAAGRQCWHSQARPQS
jgi:hypothetical protein